MLLETRDGRVAVDLGTGFARPAGQRLTQLGVKDVTDELEELANELMVEKSLSYYHKEMS